jgi:feruloyl esterase
MKLVRRLMGLALLASMAWSGAAQAADRATTSRLAVAGLATACSPNAVQAVAARLPFGMVIKPITNGPNLTGGTKYVPASAQRPGYCQITGSVVTNPKTGKTANFLATLPDSWNRKYLQFGCFAHCGFIALNDAAMPLVTIVAQGYPGQIIEKGYASFGTDQGHDDKSGGNWAIKGPGQVDQDAIDDFLYRSNQTLARAGKAFTRAFYGQATGQRQRIAYSYFCGCSGGGRDALVAASYFPEEFDGIIAGSPYANMVNAGAQIAGTYLATLRSPGADVPPSLISQIDPIVKAQCDAVDGVKDGLIQNPAACNFRAERDLPRCPEDKPGSSCFTRAQAQTISTVLTALTDHEGRVIQPGFAVSEILPVFREGARPADINAPVDWDNPPSLGSIANATFKIFTNRNDPAFETRAIFSFGSGGPGAVTDFRAIMPRHEIEKAYTAVRMGIGDNPRNVGKLIRQNRKLLIWHNSSDEKLTPYMSVNYYKQLAAMYGGYEKLQDDIRLFMIPGSSHCSMGQQGPGNFDALSALEDWVEKRRAPDALTASLHSQTSPMIDPTKTPLRTMPLCKFPEMAQYDGKGDVNVAASWSCPSADRRMLEVGESGRQAGVTE